jgi:hypothetical protein
VDHLIFHFSSQAVSRKHVNLVDLVQGFRENITIFQSEKELSEYTHETEKFFPKEDAADGGVLRALRRHVLVPRESRSRRGQPSQPGNSGHRQSRGFHSMVPIPSRDCGDAPGVSSQPYLTVSFSPHAFKFNSSINTPLLGFSRLTQYTTSPNPVSTTIPTTQRSSCHVTSLMGGRHPLSSFPPLELLANSHDRLYMSYHRLIKRVGHMKDILRPTGVPCPRGVGLSPLFQYRPSLPRASMRVPVRRVIFL